MRTVAVCFLQLSVTVCSAQPTFKQIGATVPLATNTHDFVAVYDGSPLSGDFNNDGFQDFILSGTTDNGYVNENKLYLNDGEGSFYGVNSEQITGFIRPMSVAGDIDNDGDLDYIHNGYLATHFIYHNDGLGNFSIGPNVDLIAYDNGALDLADLDGDGDLDLICTGRNSDLEPQTDWYANDGDGLFTLMASNIEGLQTSHVLAEDIDDDGDADMILNGQNAGFEAQTLVYLNNGLGDFTPLANSALKNLYWGQFALADVDEDEDLDLMLTGRDDNGSNFSLLYLNNGSGVFAASDEVFIGAFDGAPVFFDMEGDGDMDLILNGRVLSGLGRISNTYMNNGGSFTELANDFIQTSASAPVATDVENDGDMDILLTGEVTSYNPNVRLYLNDASGNFEEVLNSPFGKFAEGGLDYGDVDNDGDMDVLISGWNYYTFERYTELYLNDGFGHFTEDITNVFVPRNRGEVHLIDLDGDGNLDASVSGIDIDDNTATDLYLNNGNGAFNLYTTIFGTQLGGSDWADVDNDGDLDYLTSGAIASNVGLTELYVQNAQGNFNASGNNLPGLFYGDCQFLDFDNDGDQDFVLTGHPTISTCATYLYENDGTGVFTSITGLPNTGYSSVNLTYGDLNGDGLLDLIFNGQGCDGLYPLACDVFLQNQSNEFELYVSLPGRIVGDVEAGDMDLDGDLDLIVSGEGYNDEGTDYTIAYFENDGAANFQPHVLEELFLHVDTQIELFDGDADGDLDLAISSWSLKDNPYTNSYYFENTLNDCEATFATMDHTACESFTWIVGNTYTESNNSATYFIMNDAGCDSIVTLNLTITQPTFSIDTQSSCESFTWIDGNTYTESNNNATYLLTNAAGCDSIVTLNLNITQPTTGIDIQISCESFTWIDGNTYTETNNSATYVLTNAAGCDSIVTLNLNITQIDASTTLSGDSITVTAGGAAYQWINCNNNSPIAGQTNQTFTPTVSGNYAVIVSQNGCEETSDCVAVTIISVDEISANKIVLFPNPSSGIFQIQASDRIHNVRIYDALGKEMDIEYLSGSNQVNCGKVASGNYIVELILGNEIVRKSLRIQE